jgi:hypothetical protein
MEKSFLKEALRYADMGLSVIPIIPGLKKPLVKWQQYQTTRATKEQITEWWTKTPNANIGIVTGAVSDVFVVDIDTAEGQENLLQYGFESITCPTVTTPRDGQHLYFKNPTQKITIGAGIIPGTDFRGNGGFVVAPPSVNGNGKGYVWQNFFDRGALPDLPDAYIKKITAANPAFAAPQGDALNNINTIRGNEFVKNEALNNVNNVNNCYIFEKGRRDDNLFHIAHCLAKTDNTDDYIRQTLTAIVSSWGERDEAWVNAKVQSAIQRKEIKERNISQEVRDWSLLNDVNFLLKDCYNELKLVKKEEMLIARVTLGRMVADGLIEKDQYIRGKYLVKKELEENIIDLAAADNTCLPIRLPLGIHELVKIMPKNIIVVAGESNAGKSAFLLNIAAKNMIDHKVFYFSSEMGGAELKERLQNFNEKMPFKMWEHCTFIERANDFDIAIRPDDINIIDFLEIHDEFYKIGGFIKKIFDKLNKGIAVIAIQKNKGRDDGLGGARSIEKARLYLSMRPGAIKIVKAKNWVSGLINPNGLEKQFKLAKGMIFSDASNWEATDVN